MRLRKYHALGNDYLVLETGEALGAAAVRALCDRHRGVGADGVLEPLPSERATAAVRIWNPDGSTAEKSGNGLRILAAWLVGHRGAPRALSVELPGEVVRCRVGAGGLVRVEMGRGRVGVVAGAEHVLVDAPVEAGGARLRVTAVDLGNPHCVVFTDEDADLDALPWRDWGARLERHPLFPRRTNVQVVRVAARDLLELRIWERGAGPTLASGSSASAAALAARRLGRCDPEVRVRSPGGELRVSIGPGDAVALEGPAAEVALVEPAGELLRRLRGELP